MCIYIYMSDGQANIEREHTKMEETEPPQTATSASLFPVASSNNDGNNNNNNDKVTQSEWLRNQSFTTDLSVINDAVSKYQHYALPPSLPPEGEEEEEQQQEDDEVKAVRPQYELVDSSASDEDGDDKERRRKKKKKKKRKREREEYSEAYPSYGYYGLASRRKPDVQAWASSSSSRTVFPTKDYYLDSRGDPDNLAFGSLYKMDIARYKLYNSRKAVGGLYHYQNSKGGLVGEVDVDALDANLRSEGRYWSPKYAVLERHKNMKRIRVIAPQECSSSLDTDFIPLSSDDDNMSSSSVSTTSKAIVFEESWEEEMLRKTREFNKMTRERPHDENAWLAFADFQDKVSNMQTQKGARLQTLEKKISILEKAVELNPDSEDLLLALMRAYQNRDSTDVFIGRWEKILMQNSGSYKLWREFLRVVQCEFSRFKVSEMRRVYANAIRALFAACSKQTRQVKKFANASVSDPSIVRLELGLVDNFISLCRFEWQAGYKELATALFQAEIEYSLFSPSILLTEQSKQRLFEYFWNGNGARVGEDGALGWASWLEKEEEQRQRIINEELSHKDEGEGGWTGWSEPLSKNKEPSEFQEAPAVADAADENINDEFETRDAEQDDTESLLKMLGIDAAAEVNGEVKDPNTWSRWVEEELNRDSHLWMPIRSAAAVNPQGIGVDDAENDEQLLRVILFEDVSEYLFSINSEEARQSLASQFIDFYGGKIAQWSCTNSSSWVEKSLSLEALPHSILEDLRGVYDVLTKDLDIQIGTSLEILLGSSDNISMQTSMMKFLRNASLLCLTAFPQMYKLQEAALIAEELLNTQMNSSNCSATPCRALAKNLLKSNRQDFLLCGVYARREAAFGNIDLARRVFDLALSSIEGLPSDIQSKASLLYLWYAEVEVANGSVDSTESSSRAMHILSCLGTGEPYSPYICQPSNLQQLRARLGFKERIRTIRSAWTHGVVDDHSTALICSAALFEDLTTGWPSAVEILDEAFTMVLPERRQHSFQLELLFNYYVKMLCEHHTESKLSKLWGSIVTGLEIYPFNPDLYVALIRISHLHTSPNKLRFILDDFCHKKPSVIVWLFALSFEMGKGGSMHRIRGLFERALENEKLQNCVILWRCYLAYEIDIACNPSAARRVYFRAIHACPWSKRLWFDGFRKLHHLLTAKELSDLHEVMRDKELNLRTDIYEILLQDEME